ncbi:hypothetical protein [Methyloglobulus sp.]|uniref:hypothetical protein n=1 Tax=Methyloglobulus sp. TaxID=2518622 RepID=UPI0032B7AE6E
MSTTIAALLGALIGSSASIVTMIIQQRYQNKRELLKIAADLALQDYKRRFDLLKDNGEGRMPPISAFVHYQMQVLEHMSAGSFNPETIKSLSEEYEHILDAYASNTNERASAKKNK